MTVTSTPISRSPLRSGGCNRYGPAESWRRRSRTPRSAPPRHSPEHRRSSRTRCRPRPLRRPCSGRSGRPTIGHFRLVHVFPSVTPRKSAPRDRSGRRPPAGPARSWTYPCRRKSARGLSSNSISGYSSPTKPHMACGTTSATRSARLRRRPCEGCRVKAVGTFRNSSHSPARCRSRARPERAPPRCKWRSP